MRTPTTFGIEYSFVPFKDNRGDLDEAGHMTEQAYQRLRTFSEKLQRKGFERAHKDDSAVEVPSPVHRSLASAKSYYLRLAKEVQKLGLTARRIDVEEDGTETYHGTGGGHIHLGVVNKDQDRIDRLDYEVIRNLMVYVTNRPWLGWVFNEFMDDINARSLVTNRQVMKILQRKRTDLPKRRLENNYWSSGRYSNRYQEAVWMIARKTYKQFALNLSDQGDSSGYTLEFRFFDAPRCWDQVVDHVKVVMAIYEHVRRLTRNGEWLKLEVRESKDLRKFRNRKKVEREFRRFCREHGLDWGRYERYMENFDDRKRFGRLV